MEVGNSSVDLGLKMLKRDVPSTLEVLGELIVFLFLYPSIL